MSKVNEIIDNGFEETDILVEEIPNLDLYMDQILTFFSDRLLNKGYSEEEMLTKTMINNYSKERIISPIKGKKYNRHQIMQLLCIMNLKQNFPLAGIKPLIDYKEENPVDLEVAYTKSLALKTKLREEINSALKRELDGYDHIETQEEALAVALAVSSCATYLRKIGDQLVEGLKNEKSE